MDALSELLWRQWTDLHARPSGPFSFRFLLQPTMAIIAAVKDGLADARTGRPLSEGLHATLRIILLGLVIDAAYQIVRLRTFYPVEAVIIALVLAFVPYLLTRGPVTRVVLVDASRAAWVGQVTTPTQHAWLHQGRRSGAALAGGPEGCDRRAADRCPQPGGERTW